jgi:hypothetical protein
MTQLTMFREPPSIIQCPRCGYGPVVSAPRKGVYGAPPRAESGEHGWTTEDQLAFFDWCGADEGCVFCPKCGCEFAGERLRQ